MDLIAAFDVSKFQDMPSGELNVKDPFGAPTGMVITLAGPEQPDRKRRQFARQRRLRNELSKTGRLPRTDPEDDDRDEIEELVASTLGWTGSAVPYSVAAARDLYSDTARQWLRVQVKVALDERELFIRSSATT